MVCPVCISPSSPFSRRCRFPRSSERKTSPNAAAAAVVVEAYEDNDRGIIDQQLAADGADADKLWVPDVGFRHRPYVDVERVRRTAGMPTMDGRYVFKMATTRICDEGIVIWDCAATTGWTTVPSGSVRTF